MCIRDSYNSGTGIGLSFSKKLAEIHKGILSVTSEPNVKTTFTLSIPAFKEDYTKEEIVETEDTGFVSDNSGGYIFTESMIDEEEMDDKNSILIVEDNQELSEYLKNQFSAGFQVYLASNGKEGFNIAREKIPDIIVSDVMMNEMDGYELCRMVKNDFLTNHIPFVMLTALSSIENKMSGIETGADAYVEKPFEFKYLNLIIQNLLNQRSVLRDKYFLENKSLASFTENSIDTRFLLKIEKIVSENLYNSEFNVNTLAGEVNMSRSQLFRKFKVLTGSSPSDFIRIARLKKAAEVILKEGGGIGVNELAYEVGFASPSHFISCFKKYYGKTPKEYALFK
jgi:DNA-binding response OmpR family regulator